MEISDLAAARIVVQTDDMIDPVAEMIERQFDVDQVRSIDNRIRPEGTAVGYRTVHKIARLKETLTRHDELKRFSHLVVEIQIRTILQHGWAEVSHMAAYKQGAEVDPDIDRRLVLVAQMLEHAEAELAAIQRAQASTAERIRARLQAGDRNIPINTISIPEFVRTSPAVRSIGDAAISAGFETTDDVRTEAVDQLISVAHVAGVGDLETLERTLTVAAGRAKDFFEEFQRLRRYSSRGTRIHWSTVLLVAAHAGLFSHDQLRDLLAWVRDFSSDLLNAAQAIGTDSGSQTGAAHD